MDIQPPKFNHEFMQELDKEVCFSRRSFLKWERIVHSHGDTLLEIFTVRHGTFKRFADLVLYPGSHDHVEVRVKNINILNIENCRASKQA